MTLPIAPDFAPLSFPFPKSETGRKARL